MKTSATRSHLLAPHKPTEEEHRTAADRESNGSQQAVAWIIVIGLLAFTIAAAYLLWAKANGGWPLIHGA